MQKLQCGGNLQVNKLTHSAEVIF